jgi:hypothetical protein
LWPTCLSRSLPPESAHVEPAALAEPLPAGDVAVVPLVPAVVPAVPVAPAVVVALGSVVVADALPAGSMRALFSVKLPSLAFARHPVTLTSVARSLDMGRCEAVDVGDGVEVGTCAPSETANPSTAATHVPVAIRFIVSAS